MAQQFVALDDEHVVEIGAGQGDAVLVLGEARQDVLDLAGAQPGGQERLDASYSAHIGLFIDPVPARQSFWGEQVSILVVAYRPYAYSLPLG